ncbi:MAG: NYN domain-containing protein [Ignavibacteria bacterium]|nr:NYN domain-containing protein [Ignavibacteria bacterium]
MRVVIIDGNNLLHKTPGLKKMFSENPETAQFSLYESVKSKVGKHDKLILVFDGFSSLKSPHIVFSGKKTADEVIRKYIEDNYEKHAIAVVTSDNGILSIARMCGCEILKSEEFVAAKKKNADINQLYIEDKEKPDGMSRKDFDFFKNKFT